MIDFSQGEGEIGSWGFPEFFFLKETDLVVQQVSSYEGRSHVKCSNRKEERKEGKKGEREEEREEGRKKKEKKRKRKEKKRQTPGLLAPPSFFFIYPGLSIFRFVNT